MMSQVSWNAGTLLRFLGSDGQKKHMGVALSSTKVLELISHSEDSRAVSHVYLTDVNEIHPLTERKPTWFAYDNPLSNWTIESCIDKIAQACLKYEGSDYHLVFKNCQHFAYEAITGRAFSPDADSFKLLGALANSNPSFTSLSSSSKISLQHRKEVLSVLNKFSQMSPEVRLAITALDSAIKVSENLGISSYRQSLPVNSYKISSLSQLRDALSKCNHAGSCGLDKGDFRGSKLVTKLDDGHYVYHLSHWAGGQHIYITSVSKSDSLDRSYSAIVESYFGALLGRTEIFEVLERLR